jgi:LacI family transcriptional regulator
MKETPQTIAVAFDLNFRHATQIFRGISNYVKANQVEWRLIPLQIGFEAKLIELAKSGQISGAVGTFVSDLWIEGLQKYGVEAVNLFNFSEIKQVPSISINDFKIGKLAAKHLLNQGAKDFAFYGADSIHYTVLRRQGFQSALQVECTTLNSSYSLQRFLKEIVRNSIKPVGIFCSNDRLARECIITARQEGLNCPEHFLIIGVDNDPAESIFAGVEITSFDLPVYDCGKRAAEILHQQLLGKHLAKATHHPGKIELLGRQSSLASNRARIAQRARDLVNESLADPELDAASLALRTGVSRRILELALQSQFNTSPYRLITKKRLEHAKLLLHNTQLPIMEVGRLCGYPEPHHFSTWFKNNTNSSPKGFRTMARSV